MKLNATIVVSKETARHLESLPLGPADLDGKLRALLEAEYRSELSGRFSFALVDPPGRLYGRNRERGVWHRHPFDDPEQHEPTPEGMSPRPLLQFMAEVEEIILENELI